MKTTKRVLGILLCVCIVCMCMPWTAFAIEYYDLNLMGKKVSSNNMNDIFADGGSASFDPMNNTLYLTNVQKNTMAGLTAGEVKAIASELSGTLTIYVTGENVLDVSGCGAGMVAMGICHYGPVIIEGEGSLRVVSGEIGQLGNYGLYAEGDIILRNKGNLYFEAGEATGGGSARSAGVRTTGTDATITIDGPQKVEAVGFTAGMYEVPEFEYDMHRIYGNHDPEPGDERVYNLTKTDMYQYLYIRFERKVIYPVRICDLQVNEENYEDINGDGTLAYDPEQHSLVLNNLTLTNWGNMHMGDELNDTVYGYCIYTTEDLDIKLYGDNHIEVPFMDESHFAAIIGERGISFSGPGKLTIICPEASWTACVLAGNYIYLDTYDDVKFVGGINEANEGYGLYSYNQVVISSTATGRTIQMAGSKSAMYNKGGDAPFLAPAITAVKGSTEVPGIMSNVTLTNENYDTFKMLTFEGSSTVKQGDVNGDGILDMKDVLMLRKHIAKILVPISLIAADVNNDADIDMKDVLFLRRILVSVG